MSIFLYIWSKKLYENANLEQYNIFRPNIKQIFQIENTQNTQNTEQTKKIQNMNKIINENMMPITTINQVAPIPRNYNKSDEYHYKNINQNLLYLYLGVLFISIKIFNSIQHR